MEVGGAEIYWSKHTKLKSLRMSKSRGIMYSMMTIINNSVLNAKNVLRVNSGTLNTHPQKGNYVRR